LEDFLVQVMQDVSLFIILLNVKLDTDVAAAAFTAALHAPLILCAKHDVRKGEAGSKATQ